MHLNTLKPAQGSKTAKLRVGRGIGCTKGKTCGRGHKGQKARNNIKQGLEGGQMPFARRVPKSGFNSWKARVTAQVRLSDLEKIDLANFEGVDVIDLNTLKLANIVNNATRFAKVIKNGEITKAVNLKGLGVTAGARKAIEAAGGKVEE